MSICSFGRRVQNICNDDEDDGDDEQQRQQNAGHKTHKCNVVYYHVNNFMTKQTSCLTTALAVLYVSEAQACKRISSSASLSTVAKSDISAWIRVPRLTLVQFARILVAYIDFFWIPCQLPICILLNRFLADWLPRVWDLLITAMMMVCRFANHEWWILEIRVLCRVQHVLLRWSRAWYYLNDDIHCIFKCPGQYCVITSRNYKMLKLTLWSKFLTKQLGRCNYFSMFMYKVAIVTIALGCSVLQTFVHTWRLRCLNCR